MKSVVYSTAALAALASAGPIAKRAASDVDILNYALTLEHLEAAFYKQGLAKYSAKDFQAAGVGDGNFYKRLHKIGDDEADHVNFLTLALKSIKATPVAPCTYSFPYKNPAEFAALASVLEGVGVSAYLGAASLISNKAYTTAAASILTVEARHNAFLRATRDQSPAPVAYDIPLDLDQVYSLAAPFITSCPKNNPALPVKKFPSMLYKGPETATAGKEVKFALPDGFVQPKGQLYCAFPNILGNVFQKALVKTDGCVYCKLPPQSQLGIGVAGQTYAYLTLNNNQLTDDNILYAADAFNVLVET